MSTLFISHSSRDNSAAAEMKDRLEEMGHNSVFLDLDPEVGLKAGVSWERTLYAKLRACRAVIALCSDNYLSSHWCFAEVALARMEGKDIFTLKINPFGEKTQLPSILREGQYLDFRSDKDAAYKKLETGFKAKGIMPEERRNWSPGEAPYPGLRAFEERDAPIFFGRDTEARQGMEMLNRMRRQGHPRMAMVLGTSGSGKSSLTRAAIVPQLRRSTSDWTVVGPFRPGSNPLREASGAIAAAFEKLGQPGSIDEIYSSLAAAGDASTPRMPTKHPNAPAHAAREKLLEALTAAEQELTGADEKVLRSAKRLRDFLKTQEQATHTDTATLDTGKNPLADIATRLRLQSGELESSVLLVIDQFEELLGHDEAGPDHPSNKFLRLLHEASESGDHPPLVLGTMRSDYLEALLKSEQLRGLGFKDLTVGPMSDEGMRQIIVNPAKLGQIVLEDGLAEMLLRDTSSADALPLLAFTLRAMWERFSDDRLLEIAEYEQLGRLQGAVAQVADETMEAALELGQEADLRNAFLRLARPTESGAGWARQPVSWNDFPDNVRPMLQKFVDSRLLVIREDDTLEVTHESLFRSWGTLVQWLNTNSEALYLLHEIQVDAGKWKDAAADDKEPYLWRGGRLARALELAGGGVLTLEDTDEEFIAASDRAERQKVEAEAERQQRELRRARQLAIGSLAALIIVAALGWMAYLLKERAESVQENQIAALSRYSRALQDTEPLNALVEGIRAAVPAQERYVDDDIRSHVMETLRRSLRSIKEKNRFYSAAHQLNQIAISDDSSLVAAAGADNSVQIWNLDGQRLASLPTEGTPGHIDKVLDVAFAAGDRVLASGSADGTIIIWELTRDAAGNVSGQQTGRLRPGCGVINAIAFNRDGTMLAAACQDWVAKLWRMPGLEPIPYAMEHDSGVFDVAFSPDGRSLATASSDNLVKRWRLQDGSSLPPLPHDDDVRSVAFSPDGDTIITGSDDKAIRLWTIKDGKPEFDKLSGHTGTVLRANYSRDGQHISSASGDRTVRVWDKDGRALLTLRGHSDAVWAVEFLPAATTGTSSSILLSAGHDGTVRVWNFRAAIVQHFSSHEEDKINRLRSNDRGDLVIATDKKVTLRKTTGELVTIDVSDIVTTTETEMAIIVAIDVGHDGIVIVTEVADTEKDDEDPWSQVSFWSLDGKKLHASRASTEVYFTDVRFRSDGSAAATVGEGLDEKNAYYTQIKVWPLSGSPPATTGSHDVEGIKVLAFSPDDSHMAYAGAGKIITLRSVADGSDLEPFDGHLNDVYDLEFSRSNGILASASDDNTVRLWNPDGDTLQILEHEYVVRAVRFSPDGNFLATSGDSMVVALWSVQTGQLLQVLEGHREFVRDIAFTGDQTLVSTDGQTLREWDLTPAQLEQSSTISDLTLAELLGRACGWTEEYFHHDPRRELDKFLCANVEPE